MQGGNLVKGYKQWEKEFDRHVKPGEKAIKILAPSPFTVKKQVEKIDPDTQKPVTDKDGKPVTEEKEIKHTRFSCSIWSLIFHRPRERQGFLPLPMS